MMGEVTRLATDPNSQWVKRWECPSESNPTKSYVVAQNKDGEWGCGCPVWIYRRQECKHIRHVLADLKTSAPKLKAVEIKTDHPVSIKELTRASFVEI